MQAYDNEREKSTGMWNPLGSLGTSISSVLKCRRIRTANQKISCSFLSLAARPGSKAVPVDKAKLGCAALLGRLAQLAQLHTAPHPHKYPQIMWRAQLGPIGMKMCRHKPALQTCLRTAAYYSSSFCEAIVKGLGISVTSPYFQGDISEIITAIKIQIRFQTWHEQPRLGSHIF